MNNVNTATNEKNPAIFGRLLEALGTVALGVLLAYAWTGTI